VRKMPNKYQEAVFNLMKLSSFNDFDGEAVVKSLIENEKIWKGAIWGRFTYLQLIPLRDIAEGHYNADTLMISVREKYIKDFIKLARSWKADEIGYNHNGKKFGPLNSLLSSEMYNALGASPEPYLAYFRVWWD